MPERATRTAGDPRRPAIRPGPAAGAAGRSLLAVLFLIGVFNAVDRHILVVLLEPIRLEFGASDAAMGLLTGFAFVLFYSLSTLPIARLADVRGRRPVILLGLSVWSAMTAASGFAASYGQLVLARVGVGVGEASYLPPSMSMIADRFPHARRTLAMTALSVAFPVGIMISLVVGSRLGAAVGWRQTMILVGGAGLVLAVLARALLVEPERGAADGGAGDATLYGLRETLRYLVGLSSIRHVAVGAALSFFTSTSVAAWAPTFLQRAHGLDVAGAGAWLGPATGLGGITGVLVGGVVTQRLARRDVRWLLWAPTLSGLSVTPCALLFLTLSDLRAAIPAYVGVTLFASAMVAPSVTAVQGLAKVRMRALAAALVSLVINLAGIGLGPLVGGALSDALRPRFGDESIRYALMVTACFSLWSAVHFARGARRLREEMARV